MRYKAFLMLILMLFYSVVLVPRAHATAWEGTAARIAYRAMAPSVIAALGSGVALVVGAVVAGGIGYLIYKSGALSAIDTWWDTTFAAAPYATTYYVAAHNSTVSLTPADTQWRLQINGVTRATSTWADCLNTLDYWLGTGHRPGAQTPPSTTQDYSSQLVASQPALPSNSVYGTPGAAAAITGGAAIVSTATMTDSEADAMISGLGASPISSAGTQAGNPNAPAANDNTMTTGDSTMIGYLSSMLNYLSHLVGLEAKIDSVKTSTDNVASSVSTMSAAVVSQSAKLDNIAAISSSQSLKLDNIVAASISSRQSIDNVAALTQSSATKIEHLDNSLTLAPTSGQVTAIAAKWDGIYDVLITKFPFSWFSVVPAPSGLDAGTSPDVVAHIGGVEVDYSPWKNSALNSIIGTVKTMLGLFMWAVCVAGIYRRITLGES